MLKDRREEARKRMERARQDFAHWDAALDIELRRNGTDKVSTASKRLSTPKDETAVREEGARPTLVLQTKADVFKQALRAAGKPLKPSEIEPLVKGLVSHAYIYRLVKDLKLSGELEEDETGRFYFSDERSTEEELRHKGEPARTRPVKQH